jgi:predicted aspartyl protease
MTFEVARGAAAHAIRCALALWAMGCGSPSEAIPPLWLGHQGQLLPATAEGGVFSVQADVDGVPGPRVLVDTGAPYASLNVDAFGGAVALGAGHVATLALGGTVLWKVPTYGVSGGSASVGALGGILGFTVFGQFEMSFNYRDSQVVVGPATLPDQLLEPITIPMTLEGGGPGLLPDGSVLQFSPSRIILDASVEGTNRVLLLDTGASSVALRSDLFQAIATDGRAQAKGTVRLVTGDASTTVMRLNSVGVDSAQAQGPLAVAGGGIDDLLHGLGQEVGHTVDGLLGAPFLQHYFVTVDYPNRQIILRPYTTDAHIVDPYHRVGILLQGLLGETTTSYLVASVLAGTDAARQGIRTGEALLAIDQVALGALDFDTADGMLRGAVGAKHTLTFATRSLAVQVDELLPP